MLIQTDYTGALSALNSNPKIGRAEVLRRSMQNLIDKGGYYTHPIIPD